MAAAVGEGELRVIQRGGARRHVGGNRLVLYEIDGGPALLKVYRRRGRGLPEMLRRVSYALFESRQGVTARQRCENERRNLPLWRAAGFDVPAVLEHPPPAEYRDEPVLWLEYCPGTLLHRLLRDPAVPLPERRRQVTHFAAGLARRQRLALERKEHRLVMKHATFKHVLIHEGRQVSFDLETVYAPRLPIRDALADELGGFMRSLWKRVPRQRLPEKEWGPLGQAFVEGYEDRSLLREIAAYGVRGGGGRRAFKRYSDARRRGELSEVAALLWLLEQ